MKGMNLLSFNDALKFYQIAFNSLFCEEKNLGLRQIRLAVTLNHLPALKKLENRLGCRIFTVSGFVSLSKYILLFKLLDSGYRIYE